MMIGEFNSGAFLFQSLPEDVFLVITRPLSPTDICNLSLCSKTLYSLVGSDKIWLMQCQELKALPSSEILQWRIGISSYKALCRFLVEVMKPLVGIWVYQNPELGNVVCVMPAFLSVVGCRIIPQEVVGPLGFQDGRVLWSPVFEIICSFDGSPQFFLHGRDKRGSCLYPGFVTGIEKSCNVLLLEVEPMRENTEGDVAFEKLPFGYRRDLLDVVTRHVGLHVSEPLIGKLFLTEKNDEAMLLERRTMLLKMHKFGGDWEEEDAELCSNHMVVNRKELRGKVGDDVDSQNFLNSGDTFGLGLKASEINLSSYKGWPIMHGEEHYALCKLPIHDPTENRVAPGFAGGLKPKQSFVKGTKMWGLIYKEIKKIGGRVKEKIKIKVGAQDSSLTSLCPSSSLVNNQEYAGLWGGTFGWPPGKITEDRPENAFFLLMLSYDNSREDSNERLLIGTKILEGTRFADHPNGSVMFAVNIDKPSLDPFPFDADERNFERSYTGKGIANGYGFRYPGLKPGTLFVFSGDLLAFVWQETNEVFTVQRLNLEEILKKGLGLCVPPLRPTMNFSYMERSYTNVFTKPSTSSSSSE